MRPLALLTFVVFPLLAQTALVPANVQVAYDCPPADAEAFGLNCTEEQPCPVFLELASASSAGERLFVTGNLHTTDTTLFSLLLASDDRGVTWTEPMPRLHNAALEQIEFFDKLTGWLSGESIDPLTRNPFLMVTRDGGKTWKQKPLFDDPKFGVISQFHFASASDGELLFDTTQGKAKRVESYVSHTGGESWELQGVSAAPRLASVPQPPEWRVRADSASRTFHLERATVKNNARGWEKVAAFTVHVTDCR